MISDEEIRLVARMSGFDGPEEDTGEMLWSGNFYALKQFFKVGYNTGLQETFGGNDD